MLEEDNRAGNKDFLYYSRCHIHVPRCWGVESHTMSNFEAKQGNLRKLHRSRRVVGNTRLNSPLVILVIRKVVACGWIIAFSQHNWDHL